MHTQGTTIAIHSISVFYTLLKSLLRAKNPYGRLFQTYRFHDASRIPKFQFSASPGAGAGEEEPAIPRRVECLVSDSLNERDVWMRESWASERGTCGGAKKCHRNRRLLDRRPPLPQECRLGDCQLASSICKQHWHRRSRTLHRTSPAANDLTLLDPLLSSSVWVNSL